MSLILSRMCVITRVRKTRSELVKITRVKNEWVVDHNQKLFGRSIYIDLNDNTLKKFQKQQKRFKFSNQEFENIVSELIKINAKTTI